MVKIRNVYGDEYKGRQGNAVYQKFYGRQIRRLWDGKKENRAPQQEEQKKRFKMGLAFWESLGTEEREKLKEYLRGSGSDLTAQQWAVKVALSRPRVVIQQEEVLANLVEWVEGWDAIGWPYRQKITLTNDLSTDLVGYQKLLELDSTKVGDHFRWDLLGADLRFYDSDGNKLKYWVESWDEQNKQAKVWVRVSQIPAQGQTTIKMYYGNAQAESESDGDAVFEFFDDFDGTELDTSKWTSEGGGTITVENGKLRISTTDTTHVVYTNFQTSKHVIEAEVQRVGGVQGFYIDVFSGGYTNGKPHDGYSYITNEIDSGHAIGRYIDRNWAMLVNNGEKLAAGTEYIQSAVFKQGLQQLLINYALELQATDATYSTLNQIGLRVWGDPNGGGTYEVDWFRVRKYAEQEPTVTVGSEEVGQEVTHGTTKVTVKAIEQVAIDEIRVFDEQGSEIWKAENLTDVGEGRITSRVTLPREAIDKGVKALVRSAAGTVDVVNL